MSFCLICLPYKKTSVILILVVKIKNKLHFWNSWSRHLVIYSYLVYQSMSYVFKIKPLHLSWWKFHHEIRWKLRDKHRFLKKINPNLVEVGRRFCTPTPKDDYPISYTIMWKLYWYPVTLILGKLRGWIGTCYKDM